MGRIRDVRRTSGLDALIGRVRQRWETDRRYRAAMSGVVAGVVLVSMCACMATVSIFANNVLAGGGFAGYGGQQTGGGGVAQAAPSFPTPTRAAWNVAPTPVWSSGTPSLTPPPVPTAAPTNTPAPPAGLTGSGSPTPWLYCTPANTNCDSVKVHADPNTQVTITITYPATPPQVISGQVTTSGNGRATYSFNGPHGTGTATVVLQAGAQTYTFNQPCSDAG